MKEESIKWPPGITVENLNNKSMRTKETTSGKTLLEEVGEKLQLARQELDELAVQLALGKAEVKDKFEEMKKSFLKRLNELNETFFEEIRKDEVRRKIGML